MDSTRISELLFGRKCRLAVAAWVLQHPKGRFFQSEASGQIEHASQSNITDEFNRLVELGMLDIERPPDSRRVYYVRTNSPLWDAIAAVLEAVDAALVDPGW